MTSAVQTESTSKTAAANPLYRRVKRLLPVLKWVVLAAIACVALSLTDTQALRANIASFPGGAILLFLSLGAASRVLYAARWRFIQHSLNAGTQNLGYLLRVNLLSEFVSIVLPSYLGGEGVRLFKLKQRGEPTRDALVSLVLDRVLGVATLLALTVAFAAFLLPFLPKDFTLPPALVIVVVVGSIAALAIAAWWVRRRGSLPLPNTLRGLRVEIKPLAVGVALSLVGHLLYATGYFVLFRALSAVDVAPLLAVTLVALMTASVPLSVFGVDVSDGSIVVLAGLLGVEASAALVVVALVVASRYFFSLCGLALELIADGRQVFSREAAETPEPTPNHP
jgi:hypothetical protein